MLTCGRDKAGYCRRPDRQIQKKYSLYRCAGGWLHFFSNRLKAKMLRLPVSPALRFSVDRSNGHLILQNEDDYRILKRSGAIGLANTSLLGGVEETDIFA